MIKKYEILQAILNLNPFARIKVKNNDFNLIEWKNETPISETELDNSGLIVRRNLLMQEAKSECNKRILDKYPYYKQHNIARDAAIQSDTTNFALMDVAIKSIIAKCDAIEAEIKLKNIDELEQYSAQESNLWD